MVEKNFELLISMALQEVESINRSITLKQEQWRIRKLEEELRLDPFVLEEDSVSEGDEDPVSVIHLGFRALIGDDII